MKFATAFRGYFDSGIWASWEGLGTLTYGGLDYLGTGQLLSVSNVATDLGGQMSGIDISLSGIDDEIIAIAEAENFQRRRIEVDWLFFDDDWQTVETVVPYFYGLADVMLTRDDPRAPTLSLTVEPRELEFKQARIVRLTPEARRAFFPDETGLDLLQAGVERAYDFGRADS